MRRFRQPGLAEVISLDEFRQKIQPEPVPHNPAADYSPVDYGTYRAGEFVLNTLRAPEDPKGIVVVSREPSEEPAEVFASKGTDAWYYAVKPSIHDTEALTLDLELLDEATEERLKTPVKRLYMISLIAEHVLRRQDRLVYDRKAEIPPVQAGNVEIKQDSKDKWLEVMRWRTASGLALQAVGIKRPELRAEIKEYLRDVLRGRLQYAVSIERLREQLMGQLKHEPEQYYNFLVGMCSPIGILDFRKIDKKTTKKLEE